MSPEATGALVRLAGVPVNRARNLVCVTDPGAVKLSLPNTVLAAEHERHRDQRLPRAHVGEGGRPPVRARERTPGETAGWESRGKTLLLPYCSHGVAEGEFRARGYGRHARRVARRSVPRRGRRRSERKNKTDCHGSRSDERSEEKRTPSPRPLLRFRDKRVETVRRMRGMCGHSAIMHSTIVGVKGISLGCPSARECPLN